MSKLDKLRGMLVGLAVGDALGAPVEFMKRGTFKPIDGYRDGGPFSLKAGYWTDDTSMALCTGLSLVNKNEMDGDDQFSGYLKWYRDGYMSSTGVCFDIGNQTKKALELYEQGHSLYSLRNILKDERRGAGNGALMRLAPVVIKFHEDVSTAISSASLNAQLTHPDTRCLQANKVFTYLMIRSLRVSDKKELLDPEMIHAQIPSLDPEIAEVIDGSYTLLGAEDINPSGYVVRSMEAALWAFWNASSFEEGVKLAVNLGGDSDTIGAIYGQLAGAFWGYKGIPHDLVKGLYGYKRIVVLAELLAEGLTGSKLEQLASSSDITLPSKLPTFAETMQRRSYETGIKNKYSWDNLKDFPANYEKVDFRMEISGQDFDLIKRGCSSKMNMYFDNDKLYIHYIGNGECLFVVNFENGVSQSLLINTQACEELLNVEDFFESVRGWIRLLISVNS